MIILKKMIHKLQDNTYINKYDKKIKIKTVIKYMFLIWIIFLTCKSHILSLPTSHYKIKLILINIHKIFKFSLLNTKGICII